VINTHGKSGFGIAKPDLANGARFRVQIKEIMRPKSLATFYQVFSPWAFPLLAYKEAGTKIRYRFGYLDPLNNQI
jgi:hypothetical protein